MKLLAPLKKHLLAFLFPVSKCIALLENYTSGDLLDLLPPSDYAETAEVLTLFDYRHKTVKEIVWQVKYGGNKALTSSVAELLFDHIMSKLEEENVFARFASAIVIPMPISSQRRFERGWNQTELVAEQVVRRDSSGRLKYLPHVLTKMAHTESQTQAKSRKERLENLKGSMKVANPSLVRDHFVIVIDDVLTTGATFAEARRALLEAGVKRILCVALAH